MKLHPADVAKELKGFLFFKSFSEDLLLQLAAMIENRTYKKGEIILREGENNKSLYFLRSGKIEVVLANEVVTILQTPGEVMGEMSVVSANPVATSLRVSSDAECFVIDAASFEYVSPKDRDHFKSLLYRIYSVILSERLKKTNEKARLFEISNRELKEVQNAERAGISGKVVMLEPEKKFQVIARLALGGTGVDLEIANDLSEAEAMLQAAPADLLICEDKNLDFLKKSFDGKQAKSYLLLTTADISASLDLISQLPFVDNVISRHVDDKAAASKALLTSINKVITKDIFGTEKYLSWGVEIVNQDIVRSNQREELKEQMLEHFRRFGIRSSILDRVNTVVEEMLMNAIYDAPVGSDGKSLFNHMSRKEEIHLDTHQQSHLRYACDGINLVVSVEDPFGALTKDIIINYLKSCYEGRAGSLNVNKGGAGRGLHQIIEGCDLTVFNVKKGVRTEVICIFNLDTAKKETQPGLHYFFV